MKKRTMRQQCVSHIFTAGLLVASVSAKAVWAANNIFYPASLQYAKWAGDTVPYSTIVKEVDKEAIASDIDTLTTKYRKSYQTNAHNSLGLFRWVYSARKAAKAKSVFRGSNLIEPLAALNKSPGLYPYDYVRLHFLIASDVWHSSMLSTLGQKLLAYKPGDLPVEYALVEDLMVSASLIDKRNAVAIAQEIVRDHPKSANAHGLLGDAYRDLWYITKDRAIANKTIVERQTYLLLAPLNDPYRQINEADIRFIKQDM